MFATPAMARKHTKQRPQVGRLGKHLTRRSRGRCELCDRRDGVRPYELWPFPEDPDPERTLMACTRCRRWLEAQEIDPIEAHFLAAAIWSELSAVRLAAARLLLASDGLDDPWLRDALESADVDPGTGEFRSPDP
ncbi:MAG TPA: hypothetical protein ENK18_13940 [Deltaproteobacteria bacterium]|nr:hypothetical protein [Deltaproteobacteria bacterium]